MRVQVRRLLKKYGYPPDLQKMAVEQVVEASRINGKSAIKINHKHTKISYEEIYDDRFLVAIL